MYSVATSIEYVNGNLQNIANDIEIYATAHR